MWRLIVIILTVISLNATSFAATAHAAGMADASAMTTACSAHQDMAARHISGSDHATCSRTSEMGQLCAWACLGGAPISVGELGQTVLRAQYLTTSMPADTSLHGTSPLPAERPPQSRLI